MSKASFAIVSAWSNADSTNRAEAMASYARQADDDAFFAYVRRIKARAIELRRFAGRHPAGERLTDRLDAMNCRFGPRSSRLAAAR